MGREARVLEKSVDSHPLVAWLHEELSPGRFDRTLVVTTSQEAAASVCRALAHHRTRLVNNIVGSGRPGLLGVAPGKGKR